MIYRLSAILLLSAVFSTCDALVLMRPHTARALKQTKQHVPQKIGSFHRASQFSGCGCLHGLNKDEVSQKQSMHSRGKQISNVLLLLRVSLQEFKNIFGCIGGQYLHMAFETLSTIESLNNVHFDHLKYFRHLWTACKNPVSPPSIYLMSYQHGTSLSAYLRSYGPNFWRPF